MSKAEEIAEQMYPESDTTYGYAAVQEAYIAGYQRASGTTQELEEENRLLRHVIADLQKQNTNQSWALNPERMGQ